MAARKTKNEEAIDVLNVARGRVRFYVLGESPLIYNAMSYKVWQGLLLPSGRKTAAEKASRPKHDPVEEFRHSVYRSLDDDSETLLMFPATAFKKAMMGAAVDLPGAAKAKVGRLLYVVGDQVPIWGVPELLMSVTRSSDMNRTPDVRTRAIVRRWCTTFTCEFAEPLLKAPVVSKLLGAAGMMQGIGDWRVQKGSGNFGRFELVEESDPRIKVLMDSAGRAAQVAAMATPEPFDSETEQLYEWCESELMRRGFRPEAAQTNGVAAQQ